MSGLESNDAVELTVTDGVATVTLTNPEIRNPLTAETIAGLKATLDEIEERDPRCVVITGEGTAFCAGGDIDEMLGWIEDGLEPQELLHQIEWRENRLYKRLAEFYLPTIAKINGPAFGAGANLAVACDIQLANEDAKISFGFRQVGLSLDTGTSYFLPRMVGENTAQELALTGELVEAERAEDLGIFNHVYDNDVFDDEVADFVEQIATGPTVALRNTKRLIRQGLDSTLDQALSNEGAAQVSSMESRDHTEGIEAFKEKRSPEFDGR